MARPGDGGATRAALAAMARKIADLEQRLRVLEAAPVLVADPDCPHCQGFGRYGCQCVSAKRREEWGE